MKYTAANRRYVLRLSSRIDMAVGGQSKEIFSRRPFCGEPLNSGKDSPLLRNYDHSEITASVLC